MDLSATLQGLITFYTLLILWISFIGRKKLFKFIDSTKPDFLTLAIHQKEESYILTGFSLTALSIFLGINIPNAELIIPFISISFAFAVIASTLSQFQTQYIFRYLASKADGISILSLISGFVVYFTGINEIVSAILYLTLGIVTVLFFRMSFIDYNNSKEVKNAKRKGRT